MNGTAIANQRFTMIANILPVIDDERARGTVLSEANKEELLCYERTANCLCR